MKTCGIYMLMHLASGRCYVGKSVDVRSRVNAHFVSKRMTPLSRAIAKYGISAFRWMLLEPCRDDGHASERERFWIASLGTRHPVGFNMTDGGEGQAGASWSKETIELRAAKLRGRRHTPEARARMSAATKGKPKSPEHRAQIAAMNRGRKHTAEARRGMARATLEACLRGQKAIKLTPDNVLQIRRMSRAGASQRTIAAHIGVSQPMVGQILCGKRWAHVPEET